MSADDAPRYAIYFAPAHGSPWERFGAAWLGRSAASDAPVAQTTIDGVPPVVFARITDEPRRYGFHATLKAPIRLAAGCDADAFLAALDAACTRLAPVAPGALRVTRLGDFLALRPAGDTGGVDHVAATLVRALDPFRAPAPPAELARRLASGLTAEQRANLAQWGYPHVFASYRFHLTLTGPLGDADPDLVARVESAAADAVAALGAAPVMDAVSIFVQRSVDAPFVEIARVPLRGDAG